MMKWIVLLLVVLILAYLVVRERYTNYEEALKDVGQTVGYITPTCEDGYTINVDQSECSKPKPDGTKETKDPKCPDGSSFTKRGGSRGVCEPTGPIASESTISTPAPPEGPTGITLPESTNVVGPTGPTPSFGSGKGVWGPIFTSLGEGAGGVSGDSTKTSNYPVLIGGFPEKSNIQKLDIPSDASLGVGENAQYLPFSRQPGDMDLVPNPYKGGFSGVSSGKEPVPFLTDFSAFMK